MINGIGLGHLHRDLPIMNELAKRHEVSASSFGPACKQLKKYCAFECAELPKIGDLSLNDERIDVKASIIENMLKLRPVAIKTINDVLSRFNPDTVVIDGYLLGAFVAKTHKKRIISITNCTNVWNVFPKSHFIFEKGSNMLSKSIVDISSKIIVPDFPIPYTISHRNMLHFNNESKFHYVGPTQVMKRMKKGDEVMIGLGGSDINGMHFKEVKEYVEQAGYSAVLFNGSASNEKVRDVIQHAPFIICHGGHTTIMSALSAGVPVISAPIKDYTERVNNAIGAKDAMCGEVLNPAWMDENAVRMAIEWVNRKVVAENVKIYSRMAHAMKGWLTASAIIESP